MKTEGLLELLPKFEVWLNQYDESCISMSFEGNEINLKLNSKKFKQILTSCLYRHGFLSRKNLNGLINILSCMAFTKRYESFIRIAKKDDLIELYLGAGCAVQIRKDSITIGKPLCKFESEALHLPTPILDVEKDDWKLLSNFLNTSQDGVILSLAWLIGCFNIDGEFPVLIINDNKAPTNIGTILKEIIDPAIPSIFSLPLNKRALFGICRSQHVLYFSIEKNDIPPSINEALYYLTSGLCVRGKNLTLNTLTKEYVFKKPIVIKDKNLATKQSSFFHKSIIIETKKSNKEELYIPLRFNKKFEFVKQKILGWLIKAVQLTLRENINFNYDLTNMVDFAYFVCKTEKIFPVPNTKFIEILKHNEQRKSFT